METSEQNSGQSAKPQKNAIVGGVVVVLLIVVLVIVLATTLSGNEDGKGSSTLTASDKLDILVAEIVGACDVKEQAATRRRLGYANSSNTSYSSDNFSCSAISATQRATISTIFSEFNEDADDAWNMVEFEHYFMEAGNANGTFDEMDTDDDGEIGFVEMMASLKIQSEIAPDLLNASYGSEIELLYNLSFDTSDWRWFAYAANELFEEEFGAVYRGYPNGISKADWLNGTMAQEFAAYDSDDINGTTDEIDLNEFIDRSFTGYGLIYLALYTDIDAIYEAPAVTESELASIVAQINNATAEWSAGLEEELNGEANMNSRRLLGWMDSEFCEMDTNTTARRLSGWMDSEFCVRQGDNGTDTMSCKAEGVQQSIDCASRARGCGKSTMDYIACKNAECIEAGNSETACKDIIHYN